MATDLRLDDLPGAEAEGGGLGVARLLFESVPANGAAIETWGRARLEAACTQTESAEGLAEED